MIIHLISSPRTVSTSLMYSFDNRPDTRALDEPFYAYYLNKTGKDHPGGSDILNEMPSELDDIFIQINKLALGGHVFIKNMGHHTIDVPVVKFKDFINVFFIRDPKRVIASFSKVIKNPSLFDLGIRHQWDLFNQLNIINAKTLVLDSTELLKNPEVTLKKLCKEISIDFHPCMLSWPAGAREIDGSWAKYWYASTHTSTGFGAHAEKEVELTEQGKGVYKEALPYYQQLLEKSIHRK